MQNQKIRIRLKAFDYKRYSVGARNRGNGKRPRVVMADCLPTSIERFDVLRSPTSTRRRATSLKFRTHRRLMDIMDPTDKTVDALMKLDLPAGVDVEIKL
jgi:small subunit ribosomal protein S10